MVLAVPNISALIRILNLTCLLANGQHQIFEKWPEWFRTWKLTVGQKAGQVQDPNQCKEIWRNNFALFIVNWHRWFIELMWGNAQMYICICIYMSIYVCIYAYIYIYIYTYLHLLCIMYCILCFAYYLLQAYTNN